MSAPPPFAVSPLPGGGSAASNGTALLSVPHDDGRVFLRRAVKSVGSGQAHRVEWAVGELNGVRCYFDGLRVVLSTRDLDP